MNNLRDDNNYFLSLSVFESLRKIALVVAGIDIPQKKRMMIYNRLIPRIRSLNLPGFDAYYDLVITNKKEEEKFINIITNPLTTFFRESHHFDFLSSYLQRLLEKKDTIRIWCAGCASGEEAYSIALVVHEVLQEKRNVKISILATDIDSDCLEYAQKGVYELQKIKNVNRRYLNQFYRGIAENAGLIKVKNKICELITFRRHNLIEAMECADKFDIIFCRNVTIYFSDEITRHVLNNLDNLLTIDGILVLGHSENIRHLRHQYKTMSSTIYCKVV